MARQFDVVLERDEERTDAVSRDELMVKIREAIEVEGRQPLLASWKLKIQRGNLKPLNPRERPGKR